MPGCGVDRGGKAGLGVGQRALAVQGFSLYPQPARGQQDRSGFRADAGQVLSEAQRSLGRGVPAGSGSDLVVGGTREQDAAIQIGQRRAGVESAQPLPRQRDQLLVEQAEHDQAGLQAAHLGRIG